MQKQYAEDLACQFAHAIIQSGGIASVLSYGPTPSQSLADFIKELAARFENDMSATAINLNQ